MWGKKSNSWHIYTPENCLEITSQLISLISVSKSWIALPTCVWLISVVYHAGTAQYHRKYFVQFGKYFPYKNFTSPLNFYQNNQKSRIQ